MKLITLDEVVKNMYDKTVLYIKKKNIESERKYFAENASDIPLIEILDGASYEDHFIEFKNIVKYGNNNEINQIFLLLKDYFLFSKGHDMMFKKKLEADGFFTVPIDNFIYPKLLNEIKSKYNDISIMKENPNSKENIFAIDYLIRVYVELQELLYILYCDDFQFPDNWEKLFSHCDKKIIKILNDYKITIGDFLHDLIDFKCNIMNEIFSEIKDSKLRIKYLTKVDELRKNKHEETLTFSYTNLPITYFLTHTIYDAMNIKPKSSILDQKDKPTPKKILLPKN